MTKQFYPAKFGMDAIPGIYDGYTDGSDWNGWACPFFVKEVAESVLLASTVNGYTAIYDEHQDTFFVQDNKDTDLSPERFSARTIEVDGQVMVVYGIGAYSWIWEVIED